MGFSSVKARAIIDCARMVTDGSLDLKTLAQLDDRAAVQRLTSLRGIGRWTTEYVLLRGLGRLHVFPGDDVGARNNLERLLATSSRLDYEGVRQALALAALRGDSLPSPAAALTLRGRRGHSQSGELGRDEPPRRSRRSRRRFSSPADRTIAERASCRALASDQPRAPSAVNRVGPRTTAAPSGKACGYADARAVDVSDRIIELEAVMRLDYREVLPDALKAMLGLEGAANNALDDPRLLDLVKIRASQINGCAYCLALHAGEAREHGETDERLDMVSVWREADCFGPAERAALAWCETLTRLPDSGAPDELFEELTRHYTPEQIVALTLAIVAINGWNRLNVGFRTPVPAPNKPARHVAA
jgi:AhpD family alkylhydroperoxidase